MKISMSKQTTLKGLLLFVLAANVAWDRTRSAIESLDLAQVSETATPSGSASAQAGPAADAAPATPHPNAAQASTTQGTQARAATAHPERTVSFRDVCHGKVIDVTATLAANPARTVLSFHWSAGLVSEGDSNAASANVVMGAQAWPGKTPVDIFDNPDQSLRDHYRERIVNLIRTNLRAPSDACPSDPALRAADEKKAKERADRERRQAEAREREERECKRDSSGPISEGTDRIDCLINTAKTLKTDSDDEETETETRRGRRTETVAEKAKKDFMNIVGVRLLEEVRLLLSSDDLAKRHEGMEQIRKINALITSGPSLYDISPSQVEALRRGFGVLVLQANTYQQLNQRREAIAQQVDIYGDRIQAGYELLRESQSKMQDPFIRQDPMAYNEAIREFGQARQSIQQLLIQSAPLTQALNQELMGARPQISQLAQSRFLTHDQADNSLRPLMAMSRYVQQSRSPNFLNSPLNSSASRLGNGTFDSLMLPPLPTDAATSRGSNRFSSGDVRYPSDLNLGRYGLQTPYVSSRNSDYIPPTLMSSIPRY